MRDGDWSTMRVFAFDHRVQLEEMEGYTLPKGGAFKQLCLDAALRVQDGRGGYGILCDNRIGRSALHRASGSGLWIGRPTEWPGSRPLELEPELGADCGTLVEWARENVVKVLCFCHPADDAATRAAQEATVRRLFEASRRNKLEFLLEVIPSKVGPVDERTTATLIRQFYETGVYPDWWKLEPMASRAGWANAVAAIEEHDQNTRGIVVLGLDAPEAELAASFEVAAGFDLVKGFAVGRTIFGDVARDWLAGNTDDAAAVEEMAKRYARLCGIWDKARARAGGSSMTETIRLTAAQAMMRWLSVQMTEDGDRFIEGVWAIFGHGNVAGIGEALHGIGDALPTWRGQNEQTMAHAAIAYAKTRKRRRAQAVTSSIGPGSTNLVTAAALAHVNRLPVLFLCGDVFANRRPDPVLQQIEDFDDGTVSANDAFRPVVRYFDRITRPEHLLTCLPRALSVMTDPANCGPVTLAFCQDVQAEAYDYPESFFTRRVWRIRRPEPDPREVADIAEMIRSAKRPVIVAGGGVIYSGAEADLAAFAEKHNIPFVETQAGKGGNAWEHPNNFGSPGVTGSQCANDLCEQADLVIGVGTRFQDFTTGSWTVFGNADRKLISVNLHPYDAQKHGALPCVGDAKVTLGRLTALLGGHRAPDFDARSRRDWHAAVETVTGAPTSNAPDYLPTDAQVIGAVQRVATGDTVVMCAAGTMPGALQVLWQAAQGGYHMEYGYSCMGYEVAGAMGIKLAAPEKEVICFVGDGSYMMANSELATAVMRRIPFTVVLTDNRGYGCINRLQIDCGGAAFNNMYKDSNVEVQPEIDFVAHAGSMGAHAEKAGTIAELEVKIAAARTRNIPSVIVIDTDAVPGTGAGGHWWDVAVPQVGGPERLEKARERYTKNTAKQRVVD